MIEAVRSPEGIEFGDPGDRERLAREAGDEHVVLRNVFEPELRDVADGDIAVIHGVGVDSEPLVLGAEDARATGGLEAPIGCRRYLRTSL